MKHILLPSIMVERVARELAGCPIGPEGDSAWRGSSLEHRDKQYELARAVIAIMRDPSISMTEAGCAIMGHGPHTIGCHIAAACWDAMIDEALSDKK